MFKFPSLFAHRLKFKVVVNFISKFPYILVFWDQTVIKRPKPFTLYILKVITFIWHKGLSVSEFKQTNWKTLSNPTRLRLSKEAPLRIMWHCIQVSFFWILEVDLLKANSSGNWCYLFLGGRQTTTPLVGHSAAPHPYPGTYPISCRWAGSSGSGQVAGSYWQVADSYGQRPGCGLPLAGWGLLRAAAGLRASIAGLQAPTGSARVADFHWRVVGFYVRRSAASVSSLRHGGFRRVAPSSSS